MEKKINKFVYWTPRVLSIAFVLFLMIFSLDVFDENLSFWPTVLGLFMHNIPVLILAIIIWISWKYEIVGGFAFILAGFAHLILSIISNKGGAVVSLIIDVPAFLVGILFLVGWFKKKNNTNRLNS